MGSVGNTKQVVCSALRAILIISAIEKNLDKSGAKGDRLLHNHNNRRVRRA